MARWFGLLLVAMMLALAILGPYLPLENPLETDVASALGPPGPGHVFGTDHLGRDVLARVVSAARVDLGLAALAVALAATIGVACGALAGWYGGWVDRTSGWVVDLLLAMPIYLLAMVIVGAWGNGLFVVVIATSAVNLPFFVQLVRAEVARLRSSLWVDAARMGGASDQRILFALVLPRVAPMIIVQATTNLGWAMLNAAGMSFIGIGVRPPTPEWGVLIAEGARYLGSGHWWLVTFPGGALAVSVLGFHLAGDALRDWLGRVPG